MDKIPISLCVITLNEEQNIKRCLDSVPFASDIVIVDSQSTDQTRTIAQSMGARVFNEEWRGYGKQKQRAVDLALFDWVLCLDADEALSKELQLEIYQLFNQKNTGPLKVEINFNSESNLKEGYRCPRKSFHLGRWLWHGGWYPDFQTRLFHKNKMHWKHEIVHESVQGKEVGDLKSDLEHYPFDDLSDQVLTNNKYSSLGAEALLLQNKKAHLWQLLVKPMTKFIELYIFKRGYLDGIPGYIIAISAAYSYFLKYAKLWEMQKIRNKKGV